MIKKLFLLSFMLLAALQIDAQTVSSTYPDLNVTILRCTRNGDVCSVDMIWENTGYKDIYIGLYTGNVKIYDDMGNCVDNYGDISYIIGNQSLCSGSKMFPSEVPVKVRLQFKKANELATSLSRININFGAADNEYYASNHNRDYSMKISNVPIGGGSSSAGSKSSTSTSSGETSVAEDVQSIVNDVNELVNLFKKK